MIELLRAGGEHVELRRDRCRGRSRTRRGSTCCAREVVAAGAGWSPRPRAGDAAAALAAAGAAPAAVRAPPRPLRRGALERRGRALARPGRRGLCRRGGVVRRRPLLVTANDYDVGLYNGDTGVVVDDGARGPLAAFARGAATGAAQPAPAAAVQTVHAMTVHRSQGSQFDTVTFLLPPAGVAAAHPRAALHRDHPGQDARPGGRHRGVRTPRGRPPGGPGQRAAAPLSCREFAECPLGQRVGAGS